MNLQLAAFLTNSSLEMSPSPSLSMMLCRSSTQAWSRSSSPSIFANLTKISDYKFWIINISSSSSHLNRQVTISLISSTSINPPPSWSKAMKIQFSLSSLLSRTVTFSAFYLLEKMKAHLNSKKRVCQTCKYSKKLRAPLLSASNTRNRDSAIREFYWKYSINVQY